MEACEVSILCRPVEKVNIKGEKMNKIKIALVLVAAFFVLLVVGGVTPTLAGSPSSAPPTVVLPTPVATQPKPAATTAPAGKAPTRAAAPATVPARVAPVAPKSPKVAFSMQSGYQLQNLSGNVANITITYYNQDGSVAAAPTDTIAANGSKTYPQPIAALTAGFNGSSVISSDQPLAAIVNTLSSDNFYFASTDGFSAGSTTFSLPLIMCNNSDFNTFFNVQNTGAVSASVTINYTPGSNGTAQSESVTIAAGAAKTFDQKTGSTTRNCSTLADGSLKFIGSATITSSQPVVASVFELNTTTFQTLFGYNGFAAGSATVALPLIMANNSTFYTAFQVQNVGGSSCATINVTYGANTVAGGNNPVAETAFSLGAGASKTFIQAAAPPANGSAVNNWGTIGKYIGSATISGSGCSLVAIVNEQSASVGPSGAAYEGFNPTNATGQVSMPLIMANNSSYYTAFQVQNVGGSTCATINVTYGANTAGAGNPVAESAFSLAAGASKTFIQNLGPGGDSGVNNWTSVGKYIGSATISGSGCTLAAIVNESSFSFPGDQFASYNAFNY
jgi:hypothetical protein